MDFINELENRGAELYQIQSRVLDIDMLQPLIDLGYLTFDEIQTNNPNQSIHLERAVRQFRKDYEAYRLLQQKFTFLPFDQEHYHSYAKQLNEIELDFLQSLVSFEGTFIIQHLPSEGTISLVTRVIHYRLKILGLYGNASNQGIEAPFKSESLQGLHKITDFLNWQISDIDFVNGIGNIENLIEKIYNKIDEKHPDKKMIYMDKNGHFQTHLINIQPESKVALYYEFLARIFQIRLWINGIYNGEIDGIIKDDDANRYSTKKTIRELVRYLKRDKKLREDPFIIEKGYNLKKLKVKDFYNKNETLNAYVLNVIDLLYITKAMKDDKPVVAVSDVLIGEENHRLREKLFENEGIFKDEVKKNLTEREKDFLAGHKRRLYYGIKQFGQTIKRVIRNIFRAVSNSIKLGFNLVRRLAIWVFREVKEGIKVFLHGMKFLVGKRQIITSKKPIAERQKGEVPDDSVISKYDLDCDSVIFISNKCDKKNESRHSKKCQNQMNSLNISLILTALILRWILILTSGATGWTPFLLMTARTLKQIKRTKIGAIISKVIPLV
ncbi:MAG: hypothetical protein AB8G11_26675 [Saprospiraceae bacterium]